MYTGHFDQEAQIFHAAHCAEVEVSELLQSLSECFSSGFKDEVRVLYEISTMQVAFGLAEVEQLLQVFERSQIRAGKFAFVVGNHQFLRGVVESVYGLRADWTTAWQVFETKEDALRWLSS